MALDNFRKVEASHNNIFTYRAYALGPAGAAHPDIRRGGEYSERYQQFVKGDLIVETIWNSIISSTSFVNTVTIFSLFLTVIFFVYQEQRSRKEHTRERLRLRDEITNLIIRNHVSNGVPISEVDLQIVIDGFESLRNSSLKLSTVEVIEMVYAKVYENEHISNEMRVQLLKELEGILNSYSTGLLENKLNEDDEININSRMTVLLSFPVLMLVLALVNFLTEKANMNVFGSTIIMLTLFFGYAYITPTLNSWLEKLINGKGQKEEKNKLPERMLQVNENKLNLSDPDTLEEVSFEQLFQNRKYIHEVIEQRMILEKILTNLYAKIFDERSRLSISRMISLLVRENILDQNLAYSLKKLYQYSSFVIHEGKLHQEVSSYEDLINNLKSATSLLNQIINSSKDQ